MKSRKSIIYVFFLVISLAFTCYPQKAKAYAMLLHEAIVDAAWEKSILPLLKQKFPNASDSDLVAARAYVYGGTVVPDIGYYPFGSMFFTDLIHYVRTGDFVQALFDESQNLNDYAFAIGVLCHYTADNYGHSCGTNKAVPVLFPREKEKFGDVVTYEEDHVSHIRMEFGFDVLQTAYSNYSPQAYHDFIDFKISQPVLERAFYKTYSIDLKKYFNKAAIPILRYALKHIYQEVTEDAWRLKKSDIIKQNPQATHKNYVYKQGRKAYYKEYGKPEFKAIFFYAVVKVMPKVGPLLVLKFKQPNAEVEKLYKHSLDTVEYCYTRSLNELKSGTMVLENRDFDTGKKIHPGEYKLVDKCYYKLITEQNKEGFTDMTPPLKNNLLDFYGDVDSLQFPEKSSKKEVLLTNALVQLNAR